MKTRRKQSGFSLIEVAVSIALIVLVATTAIASLRSGLRTMGGTEQAARGIDSIRELREYTYAFSVPEVDALDGTTMAPVLANGESIPNCKDIRLVIAVTPVDDVDPETEVLPEASSTRIVTVVASNHGRKLHEASWLVADY
ncbi:MAG: prepilin-type N-terminal cleavage/methylation domain-containing protein [Planctomycetes bacterium]|nr:prepilin-type N-terminal cleavage/methylation domain-containing protein [Planctomycetota bacterium]